jgi:serine/threonine protein kinase
MHGAFENPKTITIVLSLCHGGSLCDTMGRALETNSPLPQPKVHAAFVQMCGALHYCHRNGVVHRDIKLDNLCWTDPTERKLKLIDFGAPCLASPVAHAKPHAPWRAAALGTLLGEQPLAAAAPSAAALSVACC